MKRELKRNFALALIFLHLNCRAYPDEKGIETVPSGLPDFHFFPQIAEPIPMKRELKLADRCPVAPRS